MEQDVRPLTFPLLMAAIKRLYSHILSNDRRTQPPKSFIT